MHRDRVQLLHILRVQIMATEKELFTNIKAVLEAGFATLNQSVIVKQAWQPTQQGTPTDPVVFVTLVGHHRYGSPYLNDEYILPVFPATEGIMRHTESQMYETTFQLNGLAIQEPTDDAQLTAGDIMNFAAYIMQSESARQALRAQNIGIERITEVRNPKFSDDRDRFEASPSLDFVLVHKWIVTSEVPVLQSTELQIIEV